MHLIKYFNWLFLNQIIGKALKKSQLLILILNFELFVASFKTLNDIKYWKRTNVYLQKSLKCEQKVNFRPVRDHHGYFENKPVGNFYI